MRIYIWLIVSMCLFAACTSKVKDIPLSPSQFKEVIKDCLNERSFQKQGSFNTRDILVYAIKTNYKIRDTLFWMNKLFKINPLDTSYTPEQLITVQFSYPSKKECLFSMIYAPGPYYRLVQERRFKLEKESWKLDFKNSVIQDGKFN